MPQVGPTKIGKYDVEERVGEGAMGVVYRALDPVLKRRVAIKVMSEAFAQNVDLRERFLREAQAAGSLQHPNVITIYDFGEVDGHLYIAMEFVEGQDVAELLAHQVPLALTHKLDIAIGVLQGLAFAHKRGIIHRDIKPANIRVDGEGNARIMDFGVAHLSSSDMTRTGVMIGTPSYMAPEQITGGEIGPQTDIFSAGAVLYELLTGTRPFAGGPLQAVMYRVLSEPPLPLEVAVPGLPPRLNEIVMRALAKDPEDRYTTALDMANDLMAVRASLDSRSSSPGTVSLRTTIEHALDERRTSNFKRVRRRRIAMSSGGVAAAAVLVLAGWLVARRNMPARDAGRDTTRSSTTVSSVPARTLSGSPSAPVPEQSRSAETARFDARSTPRAEDPARSNTARGSARTQSEQAKTAIPPARSSQTAPPKGAPAGTTQVAPSTSTGAASVSGAASPVSQQAPPPSVATQSKPPVSVAQQINPTPTPLPAASTANAAAEIGAVIDAYGRAIESRDMAELRRVYATITSDQASAFSDFFKSTRELRATLAVKSVQVDGDRATARVAGTYEFTTSAGHAQQQAVTFEADLRHDSGVWKLVAVR